MVKPDSAAKDASAVRSRGYQALLVCLLSVNFGVVFFDRNALSFLMPFIQPDLGMSNTQVGAFSAGLSLTWALACFVIGSTSDRIGHRKLILILCTLAFSCTSFLSGLAVTFATLLGARLLMGVAEGGVMPVSQALIVSDVDPQRRGLAMGTMQNFGSNLLGNCLSPLILVAVGAAYGWRSAFYLAGAPGLIMALLIALFVKESNVPRTPPGGQRPKADLRKVIVRRNILLCMAMSVLLVGFIVVFYTFMPLALITERHLDRQTMSWMMATFGVASTAHAFLVAGASDLFGRRPVICFMSALGILLPLSALVGGTGSLFVLFALGGVITAVFPLVMATVPSETVDRGHVATVLGLIMGTGEILGGMLGPMIAGWLADLHGLQAALWLLVVLALAPAALALGLEETAPRVLRRRAATNMDSAITLRDLAISED
jgi:MFS family permease